MKMFYAKSTGFFYSQEIHGNKIPSDAVELDEAEYNNLTQHVIAKKIIPGANGRPDAVEQDKIPKDEIDKIDAEKTLSDTDRYVLRKLETGEELPPGVAVSRAAARATLENIKNKNAGGKK